MTIEPQTVAALDRAVKTQGFPSRSKALEVALNHWLTEQKRQQIDREIERYYRSRGAQEKREDREWARFATKQAGRSQD
jgi:metal-responsive CopG/Arc/MetJ family transcriptional regulator